MDRHRQQGRVDSIHDSTSLVKASNYGIENVIDVPGTGFPPGYKFKPYDEELVEHYLMKKINLEQLPCYMIHEVQLYNHNPHDLTARYAPLGDKEWYFFTPRDRKYRNGNRPNRRTGDGFWKATGTDKPVKKGNTITGYRKALVFYRGKHPKGEKTSWIMHEYRINSPNKTVWTREHGMRLDDWVLCRIHEKGDRCSRARSRQAREGSKRTSRKPPPKEYCRDGNSYEEMLVIPPPHSHQEAASMSFMSKPSVAFAAFSRTPLTSPPSPGSSSDGLYNMVMGSSFQTFLDHPLFRYLNQIIVGVSDTRVTLNQSVSNHHQPPIDKKNYEIDYDFNSLFPPSSEDECDRQE